MKQQQKYRYRNRRATPESVASLVAPSLKRLRIAGKMKQYSVFQYWPEIVGENIAKVAQPDKIVRGQILVIRVIDATWAQELTLQKTKILEKFRQVPSGPTLTDIRFVVSGPVGLHKNKAVNA